MVDDPENVEIQDEVALEFDQRSIITWAKTLLKNFEEMVRIQLFSVKDRKEWKKFCANIC